MTFSKPSRQSSVRRHPKRCPFCINRRCHKNHHSPYIVGVYLFKGYTQPIYQPTRDFMLDSRHGCHLRRAPNGGLPSTSCTPSHGWPSTAKRMSRTCWPRRTGQSFRGGHRGLRPVSGLSWLIIYLYIIYI